MTARKPPPVQPLDDSKVRFPTAAEQKNGLTEKSDPPLAPLKNASTAAQKARAAQLARVRASQKRNGRKTNG